MKIGSIVLSSLFIKSIKKFNVNNFLVKFWNSIKKLNLKKTKQNEKKGNTFGWQCYVLHKINTK